MLLTSFYKGPPHPTHLPHNTPVQWYVGDTAVGEINSMGELQLDWEGGEIMLSNTDQGCDLLKLFNIVIVVDE